MTNLIKKQNLLADWLGGLVLEGELDVVSSLSLIFISEPLPQPWWEGFCIATCLQRIWFFSVGHLLINSYSEMNPSDSGAFSALPECFPLDQDALSVTNLSRGFVLSTLLVRQWWFLFKWWLDPTLGAMRLFSPSVLWYCASVARCWISTEDSSASAQVKRCYRRIQRYYCGFVSCGSQCFLSTSCIKILFQ